MVMENITTTDRWDFPVPFGRMKHSIMPLCQILDENFMLGLQHRLGCYLYHSYLHHVISRYALDLTRAYSDQQSASLIYIQSVSANDSSW